MKLILYSYFRSSTAFRARIALHYKNIPFEYRAVHLLNDGGEQNKPEYRKLNPTGGVPALIHEGKVIGQSRAIIEYLEQLAPSPALLPKDAYLRAKVDQICDTVNCEIHPLSNLRVTQYLGSHLQQNEDQQKAWIHHWWGIGLTAIESLLQDTAGDYAIGSEITMADVFLAPLIFTTNRFQIPLEKYPIFIRVAEKSLNHPAFVKAHPFRQPDTPSEMRIN